VQWQFGASTVQPGVVDVALSALLAPEWLLYSQHLKKGGPTPARVQFEPCEGLCLAGPLQEKGAMVTFFDNYFGLYVSTYSGEVTFIQRLMLFQPISAVRGTLEYMTCNAQQSMPGRQEFNIALPPAGIIS